MMKKSAAAALGLTLSGCVSSHAVSTISKISVDDLIHKERCELFKLSKTYPDMVSEDWTVFSVMSLKGTASDYLNPDFETRNGLSAPETFFKIEAPFSIGQKKETIFSQSYVMQLGSIDSSSCDRLKEKHMVINGDLGVAALVNERNKVMTSFKDTPGVRFTQGESAVSKQGDFAGSIEFTIEGKVDGLGPVWDLVHFTGPGGLINIDRTDVSKLEVAFVIPEKAAPPQQGGKVVQKQAERHGKPPVENQVAPVPTVQQPSVDTLKRGFNAIQNLRLLDFSDENRKF